MKADEYLLPMANAIAEIFPEATRKKKDFTRLGEKIEVKVKVKKGNLRILDSWQRVGCYTEFEVKVIWQELNDFFDFDKKEVLLNGQLRSDDHTPYYWHCSADEVKIEKLCAKVIKKHDGDFEQLFQGFESSDLIERYLWAKLEWKFREIEVDWEVPEKANLNPFWLSPDLSGLNQELACAAYIYCLLKRNAWQDAEKVIAKAQDSAVKPPVELLDKLRTEITVVQNRGEEVIKLDHPKLPPKEKEEIVVSEGIREQLVTDISDLERPLKFEAEDDLIIIRELHSLEWKSIFGAIKTQIDSYNPDVNTMLSTFKMEDRDAGWHVMDDIRAGHQYEWLKYCRTARLFGEPVPSEKLEWIESVEWDFEKTFNWQIPNLKEINGGYSKYIPKLHTELLVQNPNLVSLSISIKENDLLSLIDLQGIEQLKKLSLDSKFDKEFRELVKSKKMINLEYLDLHGELKPSAANWVSKKGYFPKLETLKIFSLKDAAMKKLLPSLAVACPELKSLELEYSDSVIEEFYLPPKLQNLVINVYGSLGNITSVNTTQELTTLELKGCNPKKAQELVEWNCIKTLKQLSISISNKPREVCEILSKLPCQDLKVLIIETYELEDEDIEQLISLIKTFDNLEYLVVRADVACRTDISKEMATQLVDATQHLKTIYCNIKSYVSQVIETGVFPNLEHLTLSAYFRNKVDISEKEIENLTKTNFPKLKFFDLQSVNITSDAVKTLSSSNLSLIGLSIDHSKSDGFLHLASPTGLSQLQFLKLPIKDEEKGEFDKLREIGIDVY